MDTREMETFGDHLRRHRRAAGLTQEDLADRAQVSPREISDLERGLRTRPRRDTIQYLATALQLEAADRAQLEAAARRPRPSSSAAILRDSQSSDFSTPRHNLPVQVTSFIGREHQRRKIQQLFLSQGSPKRLITLTGSGGCGKTRLAFEVAAGLVDRFPDGVWLVALAPLNDSSLVPQAVALALGVRELPGRPLLTTLGEALRSRRLLLLLDNCEHLIDACAELVQSIFASCPEVSILTTSREALRLTGEHVYRVPSLTVPGSENFDSLEEVTQYDSALLFVDRAREGGSVSLTDASAGAVARICQSLDGIPLALELAAARVGALGVEPIVSFGS